MQTTHETYSRNIIYIKKAGADLFQVTEGSEHRRELFYISHLQGTSVSLPAFCLSRNNSVCITSTTADSHDIESVI